MGCSQGKSAAVKENAKQPTASAEGTLLGAEEQQSKANENASAGWDWKAECERIFKLADNDGNGFIDMTELTNVRNSKEYAETMMGIVDENKDGKLSLEEWSTYVKGIFDKKEAACKGVLKLYETQINQNMEIKLEKSEWGLQGEAIRIFNLADKDGSGFIDMEELANVRNSTEFAETMMGVQDVNKDGKLSLPEWLAYVKGVFDKKEVACQGLLKLYEKQINQNMEIQLEANTQSSLEPGQQAVAETVDAEKTADAAVLEETPTDVLASEVPLVSVQPQERATQPTANLGFFSCCVAGGAIA